MSPRADEAPAPIRAPLEFWFEFASTYSYPAAMRIETLARNTDVPIRCHAFLLGPIFRRQGWQDSPFNLYPAKGRYMWRDLERICAAHGIAFRRPTQFPRNGLLAARLACEFAHEPWLFAFVREVFRANFEHDRDIADPQVLAECLAAVTAADSGALLARAQTEQAKMRLRAQTDRAAALGMFGAPTFRCGTELFWGNDRLESALTWWRTTASATAI